MDKINLTDVVNEVVSHSYIDYDMGSGRALAKGARSPVTVWDRAFGFAYADLYGCFDLGDGIVIKMIDQGLDRFKNMEAQTDEDEEEVLCRSVRALVTRAFLEGYKAGYGCRDNMIDEIYFDADEIPQRSADVVRVQAVP